MQGGGAAGHTIDGEAGQLHVGASDNSSRVSGWISNKWSATNDDIAVGGWTLIGLRLGTDFPSSAGLDMEIGFLSPDDIVDASDWSGSIYLDSIDVF
jgi:hypothetical protein